MSDDHISLREFLVVGLSFTCIKTSGAHTFWAPLDLWLQSQNRMDQPLLIRVNTAPGGKDLEVTILLANVPMLKISADDARHIEAWMVQDLIQQGRHVQQMIAVERMVCAQRVKSVYSLGAITEVNA